MRHPVGHFEIYVDPTWSEAVRDQTDFLVRTLAPGVTRPAQQATTA